MREHHLPERDPLPLLEPCGQPTAQSGQQATVESTNSIVERKDPEEEEALETVRDHEAEDDDVSGSSVLLGEDDDNPKDPGDAKDDEYPEIYEEIGSAPVPVLIGLIDTGDVVDAGDCEAVEDDVGQADKDHGEAEEDEPGRSIADPAVPILSVLHGEVGDEVGVVDQDGEHKDDHGDAETVGDVAREVEAFGPDVREDGPLAEGLVDVPGHDVGPEEDGEVGELDGHGYRGTGWLVQGQAVPFAAQEHKLGVMVQLGPKGHPPSADLRYGE